MMDWPIHIIRALQIIMQIIMVPVGYLMLLKHVDGSYEHWPMAVIVAVAWLAILKMQYDEIGD